MLRLKWLYVRKSLHYTLRSIVEEVLYDKRLMLGAPHQLKGLKGGCIVHEADVARIIMNHALKLLVARDSLILLASGLNSNYSMLSTFKSVHWANGDGLESSESNYLVELWGRAQIRSNKEATWACRTDFSGPETGADIACKTS